VSDAIPRLPALAPLQPLRLADALDTHYLDILEISGHVRRASDLAQLRVPT
jgi:hypothetical protein